MELREITGENYQQVLDLSTGAGQEKFVTANLYSLAHAWAFQKTARPYALYEGEEPVASSCLIGGRRKNGWRSGGL